jgi:Tfp pilus assembly protein PilX
MISEHSSVREVRMEERRGVALVSVLYFLVVCGLTSAALLFLERAGARAAASSRGGSSLLAAAESALYSSLAEWDGVTRARQPVGSVASVATTSPSRLHTNVFVSRLTSRLFSIVAETRSDRDGVARRVGLLVRLPGAANRLRGALVSAVDVSIGPDVRIETDTGSCGDTATATVVLAPAAALTIDPAVPAERRPTVLHDATAGDSSAYLQFGAIWWSDLALAADIHLTRDAHVTPAPITSASTCVRIDTNWGDPNSLTSVCAARAPLIISDGDLTIDGGVGQGVLLVGGHLTIDGPFVFSGQIVARGGIETRADNIAISGGVYAWRASSDADSTRMLATRVVLTRQTTLRYSRCDMWHGVASWQQPRRVRHYAWSELF